MLQHLILRFMFTGIMWAAVLFCSGYYKLLNRNETFNKVNSHIWRISLHLCLDCFYRVIRVYRGKKSFGFTLRGHAPVCIDSVIPGTASVSEHAAIRTSRAVPFSTSGFDPNAPVCGLKREEADSVVVLGRKHSKRNREVFLWAFQEVN